MSGWRSPGAPQRVPKRAQRTPKESQVIPSRVCSRGLRPLWGRPGRPQGFPGSSQRDATESQNASNKFPKGSKKIPKDPTGSPKGTQTQNMGAKGSQRGPTRTQKLNILSILGVHFGLLGSLGNPMGAFRLKGRFWTDFGIFLVSLWGPRGGP